MTSASISCVVADDHPAVLDSVCRYLQQNGLEIVGRAFEGVGALDEIERARPDVALVDMRMPGLSGTEITRRAVQRAPSTGIVLYTGHGDDQFLTEALDAGARGVVLKEAPLADLVRAVRMVATGQTYVDPGLAGTLAVPELQRRVALTQREREVLRLLADGFATDEIGRRLFISGETVRTHVRKAMRKLGADTRTQAVAEAIRQSLIA